MILRLAFCSIIQLLKMFGLDKLKSWAGGNYIMCVYFMLETYHSYRNKQQRGTGKEGCLCGWKGIGSVRSASSGSCRGLLTDNIGQFCDGCLYRLSLPEHPALPAATAPEQQCWKVIEAQAPATHQSCLELPVSMEKSWQIVLIWGWQNPSYSSLPAGPVIRGLAQTWGWECLASGSTSHDS